MAQLALSHAADDQNGVEEITVSPSSQKYEIEAGTSKAGTFKVVNTGGVNFDFIVYSKPYSVSGNNYSPNYSDEKASRADAYDWVTFPTTEGTLKPGETAEIPYTVTVPKNASIGGHYAVLFAETQPKDTDGNQVLRKKRVGSILRVNVAGDINEQGSVISSSIPAFQFHAPLVTTMDIKNDGNVDFIADSKIEVKDIFGTLKHTYNKSSIIYPATTRTVDQNWDEVAWLGIYKVDISANYLGKEFTKSQYVLIMPRWLIALAFILIVGGAYAAYIRRH